MCSLSFPLRRPCLPTKSQIPALIENHESEILNKWLDLQLSAASRRRDLINDAQLRNSSQTFLQEFRQTLQHGELESMIGSDWHRLRAHRDDLARSRAQLG